MKEKRKIIFSVVVTAVIAGSLFYIASVGAFNGPSAAPPSGNGALGVNSSANFSIGTSTTLSNTKLYIAASSTADSGSYALQILDSAGNTLFSVRNDAVVSLGSSTMSGGAFNGTVSAANVSAGSFGGNTGGGNYTFPAGLTQSGGLVSIASTTVTGNTTTTSLTITGVTSTLDLIGANGAVGVYGGSSCSAGKAITAVSATGTATCTAFGSSNSAGTVTTSTAVTIDDFAFWNATNGSGLNGTSTLSISGTTVTQANAFAVTGATTLTGAATFKGAIISTSTTLDTVSACGSGPAILGSHGIGRVTTGSTASSTCTVTFGTAFTNKPICTISQESTVNATTSLEITPSTSKLVISMSSSTAFQSMVIDYICIGQ